MNIEQFCYVPTVRTSIYNLGAITELSDEVKDLIIPRLVIRKSTNDFDSFISKWGNERPYFLEISKYPSDINDKFNQELNNPNQNFAQQYALFNQYKQSNIIPVINENSNAPLRDVIQLTLKTINTIGKIALKLDISHGFSDSIALINTILATLSNEQISHTILIIDAGKIDDISNIQQQYLSQALQLITSYKFLCIIFSSTSFPTARPASDHSENYPCIDPIWQYRYIVQLHKQGVHAIYGDCSATDPYNEQYDYDFVVKPIPYASYLLKDNLEWLSIRKGKGGEYDKFRDIAQEIQNNPYYHGDTFCYANGQIKQIADGTRDKPGNQAFWNKLKINQHISAIIDAYQAQIFDRVIAYNDEDDDYDI